MVVAAFAALGAYPASADELDHQPITVGSFLQQHCARCHGPESQENGLRIDTLAGPFAQQDNIKIWTKVLDRVTRGEMPPQEEPRPANHELRAFTQHLQRRLHLVSLKEQQRMGRVILRRLNRIEYETTLRDLLGTQVAVRDLLPDDNVAAGFDNVSAVLDISAIHLLRFQEAAETAVRSVVPTRPPTLINERRTGRQIVEKTPTFKDVLGKSVRLIGDTLLMHVRTYGHVPCATASVPQAGRYRVRASVYAVATKGQPLPVMFSCRDAYGRDDDDVRAVRDVPADTPVIIEEQLEMKARQVIVVAGWSLPGEREFAHQNKEASLERYSGQGLAVEWLEIEGPLDPFPSLGFERLFGGVPLKPQSLARNAANRRATKLQTTRTEGQWQYDPLVLAPANPRNDAQRLIRSFLPIAFRRPVSAELASYFIDFANGELDKGLPFLEAMTTTYTAILCSPHFLCFIEPIGDAGENRLDHYAIASRLSYFLWSSLPDRELFRLAAQKKLTQPEILRAQVDRMLQDSKAQRFTENFAGQWLELRNLNATSPNREIYGEFDDFLFWSMPRETQMYFDEVLRNDLPLTDFVDSDWTFLNQRLAQHYGIPGVAGGELRKVKVPRESHRGGVLTQASILKVTADGTRTSPVLRGKWVLEHILGQPPAPPPSNIPAIEPDIRGATTIREQLDKHRNTAACAVCHVHIDPPGFALESFDVIGGWRDYYRATQFVRGRQVELENYPGRKVIRGPNVELGGTTADGRPFQDIDDYKQILLSDRAQLARALAEKLIIYSTGAEIQFADREVIEQLVNQSRIDNYGLRSMVYAVAQSRVFLSK